MNRQGFTLIELLIVIAIIGILAAAVLVAVDPVSRIQDARNSRRSAEVYAILNAVLNKQIDDRTLYTGGASAPVISQAGTNVQVIVTDDTGIECGPTSSVRPGCNAPMDTTTVSPQKNCVINISDSSTKPLVPNYLGQLPVDPRGAGQTLCVSGCTTNASSAAAAALGPKNSGYYLARNAGNRITVGSCLAEKGTATSAPSISLQR